MKTRYIRSILAIFLLLPLSAFADAYSYSAKFICGTQWQNNVNFVQGIYATTVNIHNPHYRPVTFLKKAVIALPERSPERGPISPFVTEVLRADEAMGVDCDDIRGLFPNPPKGIIEGFVVIQVPAAMNDGLFQLDVVDVNTVKLRKGNSDDSKIYDASSIDVEEVKEKFIFFPQPL